MTDTVLYEVSDAVATVTLNRPDRLNAINPELLSDLLVALRQANADPAVHVIVLTGAGRAFCAGDDLKEFESQVGTPAQTRAYIEKIQDVTRALCLNRKMVVGDSWVGCWRRAGVGYQLRFCRDGRKRPVFLS